MNKVGATAEVLEGGLALAHAVTKAGFKSAIHSMPELKAWLDEQLTINTKSLPAVRRDAIALFPALKIPTMPVFYRYADKYFEKPVVEVAAWRVDYQKHMQELEAYEQMIWWAKECKANYTRRRDREQLMDAPKSRIKRLTGGGSSQWGMLFATALNDLLKWEVQLGLREAIPAVPGGNTFNQFNQFNLAPEKAEEILEEADAVADYLRSRDRLAETRNGAIVRYEDENTLS